MFKMLSHSEGSNKASNYLVKKKEDDKKRLIRQKWLSKQQQKDKLI